MFHQQIAKGLSALFLALTLTGCTTLLFGGGPSEPYPRVDPAVSSVHYRSYASADALAAALRWTQASEPKISAHRGGPAPGFPENSLAALERALNYAPVLFEIDLRLSKNGALILMHDETLDRTSTGRGSVKDHTLAELRKLRLTDPTGAITPYRIPTLEEVLSWAEGRAVLVLDPKEDVGAERLIDAVRRVSAENRVILIAYTLEEAETFHRLAPELVLSVTSETPSDVQRLLNSSVDINRVIAFGGVGNVDPEVIRLWHENGVPVQVGTFGDIDVEAINTRSPRPYDPLLGAGVDILATDNVPGAAMAIR